MAGLSTHNYTNIELNLQNGELNGKKLYSKTSNVFLMKNALHNWSVGNVIKIIHSSDSVAHVVAVRIKGEKYSYSMETKFHLY